MYEQTLPNQARARLVQIGLLIVMGIDLLFAGLNYSTRPVLDDFFGTDESVWFINVMMMMIGSAVCIVAYVVCMVFFLLWWTRANANLRRLGQAIYPNETYAVVCWFIPIGGWIAPWRVYQRMAAEYTGLQQQFPKHRVANAPDLVQLRWIGAIWWASFVLVWIVDGILLMRGEYVTTQLIPYLLPPWANILPGVFTILMIRQFSRVEESVARAVRSGDFAAHIERLEAARAERAMQTSDKVAGWHESATEDEAAADSQDPFSA